MQRDYDCFYCFLRRRGKNYNCADYLRVLRYIFENTRTDTDGVCDFGSHCWCVLYLCVLRWLFCPEDMFFDHDYYCSISPRFELESLVLRVTTHYFYLGSGRSPAQVTLCGN